MEELARKQPLWKIRGDSFFKRTYCIHFKRKEIIFDSSKMVCGAGGFSAIPLADIVEIRSGWQTDTFNRMANHIQKRGASSIFKEDRSFSIILAERPNLDLIATTTEKRDLWVSALKKLILNVSSFDGWLMDIFTKADVDRSGALNFNEIYSLLTSLKIEMNKEDARYLFDLANKKDDHGEKEALDIGEFITFYHSLTEVPDIFKVLFTQYCNEEEEMTVDGLLKFLREEQNLHDVDVKTVNRMMNQYEKSTSKNEQKMTIDGFSRMLQSPIFSVYNDYHQSRVHQDMSQPLCQYYISSSHNTYLIGDQVKGSSSIEGYIDALKRGCKLVELDLYDKEDGEPFITHGKTLTSNIYLKDVLNDAIQPYAFHTSTYPLILSIENHLSIKGQKRLVDLLLSSIREEILIDVDEEDFDELPSPELLKNKIIIKAKKPKGEHVEEVLTCSNSDSEQSSAKSPKRFSKLKKIKHLAPELQNVINICEGKKFTSFEDSFKEDKFFHFPSVKETKALEMLKECPANFVNFTQSQIMKVYPSATRIYSSNLKPYPFWAVGVQVVALNMQTNDKATFYNQALFRNNGNCGYVLKPDLLTIPSYNPLNIENIPSIKLRINVISGQHLVPRYDASETDPYVWVKVRGHPIDKQKYKTKVVTKNGLNPQWNDTFDITIKVAPVAFIYFKVQGAKNSLLARSCIPFQCLTHGYRTVHLLDKSGRKMHLASLFVNIEIVE